ncbi:MAG: NifU N-terminal domain-containing protein [Chloroflexota bacterium]
MSEYIEIETEPSDDQEVMYFYTNLRLTDQAEEVYESVEAMEEGSAVANALAVVEGIETLKIEPSDLTVSKHPDAEWHAIVLDVTAVIKDFFL